MLKGITLAFSAAPLGAALFANPIDIYSPDSMAKISGTAFVNTGNVERVLLRGEAGFSHHNPLWAAATTNSYLWGTFGSFRTEKRLVESQSSLLVSRSPNLSFCHALVRDELPPQNRRA
jgi:hypothetical protein